MKKKYQHIFFDLDNTLWDFEKNSKKAMRISFSNFFTTSEIPFEQFFDVYSKINHQLWDEYKKRSIQKKDLIYERFKQTFDVCNLSGVEPEKMNAHYLDEMARQKDLKEGAMETIQYLIQKKYVLHIITNGFKEVQFKKMETSGLQPFFSNVFISEAVKVPKPGSKIFEYAVKSSNAKKSASLMVGDDWLVDIIGANRFGIDSVYIPLGKHSGEQTSSKPLASSKNRVYIIGEIAELKKIL